MLCLVQLVRVFRKREQRKRESIFVVVYCTLGLLYGLLDIPVVLFSDLPCRGDTIVKKSTGPLCALNRVSSVLLISMYYWMAAHVSSMHLKIVRSDSYSRMSFAKKQSLERMAAVICVGVPLVSMIMILALDVGDNPTTPLYWAHVARDNFTCSPRFHSLALEFVALHVHFIICSLMIVSGLGSVAKFISMVVLKRDPQATRRTIARKIWMACPRVFLLATQMFILLAIHTALTIELVPAWESFGDASEEVTSFAHLYRSCAVLCNLCVHFENTLVAFMQAARRRLQSGGGHCA